MVFQKVEVKLQHQAYPVFIGKDFLQDEAFINSFVDHNKVMIVTHKEIADHYLNDCTKVLKDRPTDFFIFESGEQHKNIAVVEKLWDVLIRGEYDRESLLIALGGGVVGDVTGFAAACYMRGMPYIQIPTTLLAQVDSSVGGKTGVNHPITKNLIGAYYHPNCVLSDISFLRTLPPNEYRAGLAEVIKYGLILDEEFNDWLEQHFPLILRQDEESLLTMIANSVCIKSKVIEQDERDHNVRMLLNFGHTFGHLLELLNLKTGLLHGEAVGLGMDMAAALSHYLGVLSMDDLKRVRQLLKQLQPEQFICHYPEPDDFIQLLKYDKKAQGSSLRFVLIKTIGSGFVSYVGQKDLLQFLKQYTRT